MKHFKASLSRLPYQPFLVVAYIGLSIYLPNQLFIMANAMVLPLALLLGFIAIALAIWQWNRWNIHKGIVLISSAVLLNFTYYPARDRLAWSWPLIAPATALYAVVWMALIVFTWKAHAALARQMARAFGMTSLCLLFIGLFGWARTSFSARPLPDNGKGFEPQFQLALTRNLSDPLNNRDFYFIVLDRYPGVLLRHRLFDNTEFHRRLRSMGFTVLEKSRSNYGATRHSISSMLNMDYFDALVQDGYDTEDNRLWRFFKSQGFKFVFLPSNWLTTTKNDHADVVLNPYPIPLNEDLLIAHFQKIMFFERTLLGWLYYTARHRAYGYKSPPQTLEALQSRMQTLEKTINQQFNEQFSQDRPYKAIAQTHIPNTFSHLAQVPGIPGKKFVFSHINHWDYVEVPEADSHAYANQSIESLVRVLIDQSTPEPVIVIVSDHGVKPLAETVEQHRSLYAKYANYPKGPLNQDDLYASWYPLDNIGWFYLPDGGETALYPGISPVNIWRMLLNHYFQTDFERLEDLFFWKWRHGGISRLE